MHQPVSSDNRLHFYRYLKTCVLVAEQFLLLTDVPIQDRVQQLQIYWIFNLPVPHGGMSARYKVNGKYIGITYDKKKQAVVNTEQQYWICLHTNGPFWKVNVPFQTLTNPLTCTGALNAKNNREIEAQCLLSVFHTPPTFPPIIITSNLWIFISTPMMHGYMYPLKEQI